MLLLPSDYVVCGAIGAMALMGMFRGFSGTLAFAAATATAGGAAMCFWKLSEEYLASPPVRGVVTMIATLVVFGIVRAVVKRMVRGLLAGPSDSFFGLLVGAGLGIGLLVVWAYSGVGLEFSNLAREVAQYVR